jgi:hypothetical protein
MLILFVRCTDTTDCKYTANRSIKINFTELTTKNIVKDTTVQLLTIKTSEGIILYDSASATQIQLPLSQLCDTSTFYFYFDSIAVDTVNLFTERKIEMISPECGFNTSFKLISAKITLNNIVSYTIINANIGADINTDRNMNLLIRKRESQ